MDKTDKLESDRFRHFIASVTDYAIYMLTPDGIVSSWNAGAQRFKGYTGAEIIGQHFSRFYTDEDRAAGMPARALRMALEQGKFEDEGWRVRKDGTHFWASVVLDPIHDEHGELLGFTKITRDITEQRRASDELHASEERFRLLVQGVTDYAIYLLSPEGLITNWNEGARRIKGYTAEEVLGTHFSRFYTPEDRDLGLPMTALQTALSEGRFEREGWRVRKDGSRFWAHVIIDPVYTPLGTLVGFAKVTRDVTERRDATEQLERAKATLFQSQKMEAIGKLTGGIAHDFNNLLNVIATGIDIVRCSGDAQARIRALDTMERAVQRGSMLNTQLLTFARKQPLRPERQNVNQLIASFEPVLARALTATIQFEVLRDAVHYIEVDAAQFEAVLLNLVVNARDAIIVNGTGGGKVTMHTGLFNLGNNTVPGLKAGQYVVVSVQDNGCGIAPELLDKVLEPFFTTKEVGKGTGLGLSQAYGLMEQSGGRLVLRSDLGSGTCVDLYFPALDTMADDRDDDRRARTIVLVVDDQHDVLEMASGMFEAMGYEVHAATSGAEALRMLERYPDVGLLFTDVVMPGMTGVELASKASARLPHLKVLLTSGHAANAQDGDIDLAGFPLVPKPYKMSEIIRKLRDL